MASQLLRDPKTGRFVSKVILSNTGGSSSRSSRNRPTTLTQNVYRDAKTGRFVSAGMAKEMKRHRVKVNESTISLIIPKRDRTTGRFLSVG